jgi:hypothetical protein
MIAKKPIDLPKAPQVQTKQRMFQGLPIREGRGDILVQPNSRDIKSATPHDPENCAYAICLKRMLDTPIVFVYTSVAYIQTMDERGNQIMERYMVKDHAHAWVQKFDRGEEVNPGGFILHKPTGSKTLEYKRKSSKGWFRSHPERSRELSRATYQRQQARRKNPQAKQYTGTFRDGTGQVKFFGTFNGKLATHREP